MKPTSAPTPSGHPAYSSRPSAARLILLLLMATVSSLSAKPPWAPGPPDVIMFPGITAVTCAGQKRDNFDNPVAASDAYVFGMYDLRNPAASDYVTLTSGAPIWNAPDWHHPTWTAQEMGCVFGIATDPEGNIYTAANGLWAPYYSPGSFGDPYLRYGDIGRAASDELGASGTIYQIDALTGVASVFAQIPQVSDPNLPIDPVGGGSKGGPGMGSITVDFSSGNLFVTSLDDGKIYQFDSAGSLLVTYDPFTVEAAATPGMIPLGERLWAIEAHAGKLYFSVWNGGTVGNENEIWSVNLPGGLIDGSSLTSEFVVPASYAASSFDSVTVSDLSFSEDGTVMLIGERAFRRQAALSPTVTLPDFYSPHNHTTAARKAEFISGSWTLTGEVATGNSSSNGEAYGGIEFGFEAGAPEQVIWMSSADIAYGRGPHGLQGMRDSDFPAPAGPPSKVSDSYIVPYMPLTWPFVEDFKGMGGDVETMKSGAECARIVVGEVACPEEPGGPFIVTLQVENLQTKPMSSYGAVPTPASSLPAGATSIQPQPFGWQPLSAPLAQGDSTTITFELPGLSGGEFVCFNLTFLDPKFEECCTETVCVDVPECECAIVHDIKVVCRLQADGTWAYDLSLTLENTSHLTGSPLSAYGISFGPDITAFSPNYLDLSGDPFDPGETETFTTTYTGPSGTLCFKVALHTEGNVECCFLPEICIELPPCEDDEPVADCCLITPEKTFCYPFDQDNLSGLTGAVIRYTICNKSNVERLYDWTIENLGPGGLEFAFYDPASGLIPVTGGTMGPILPGACETIEIYLICEMEPGECADYLIRAGTGPGAPELFCRGQICQPEPGEVVIKSDGADGAALAPGQSRPYEYLLVNPRDAALVVPVFLSSSYGALGISLKRGERGESALQTTMSLPANSKTKLVVYLSRLDRGAILPTDSMRLFANAGEPTPHGSDDHVSALMLTHRRVLPFRVLKVESPADLPDGFVKLDLFLERGPLEMTVEEFNLVTRQWEVVPIRTAREASPDQGSVFLDAGRQVLYSPRHQQSRGIFRVVCLDGQGN